MRQKQTGPERCNAGSPESKVKSTRIIAKTWQPDHPFTFPVARSPLARQEAIRVSS